MRSGPETRECVSVHNVRARVVQHGEFEETLEEVRGHQEKGTRSKDSQGCRWAANVRQVRKGQCTEMNVKFKDY